MAREQRIARDLLVDGFGRVLESVDDVLDGLGPELLFYRPDPAANHIAWLVWHLTRIEDDHNAGIADVLHGREAPRRGERYVPPGQLWTTGGWRERFGLPYPEHAVGYGQSTVDVGRFPEVDRDFLLGYHRAVHQRVIDQIQDLRPEDYAAVVDFRWDPPVTAAVRLVSILNDATQHVGQAAYVRGLAERAEVG